jgi:hypothetical protein
MVNMMSNRDVDKVLLNTMVDGFYRIKDDVSNEGNDSYKYTNEELFFLYNLFANKNMFGESSLTKIFDASLRDYEKNPDKKSNIITDFFNFERDIVEKPEMRISD